MSDQFDPRTITEPGAVVLNGNALDLPLPDESVDLCITSPPYFALRSYRDGDEHYGGQIGSEPTPQDFLEALWAATREMVRVTKPSGSIWVNLGDKYAGSGGHNNSNMRNGLGASTLNSKQHGQVVAAQHRNAPDRYNQNSGGIPAKSLMGLPWRYAIGCIDQLGLILRAEVIWSKPNGLPESVTDRVRRSHEQWFHFTKSPRYFSAVDEVREPQKLPLGKPRGVTQRSNSFQHRQVRAGDYQNPLGKLPGSVWTIPSEPLIVPDAVKEHYDLPDHFAAFPQEWPRKIILGWSPSGVCTACGEGRRPVADVVLLGEHARQAEKHGSGFDGRSAMGGSHTDSTRTITGYSCACPEPTADTTPAVILDPFTGTGTTPMVARALGRFGIGVDLSQDYCRLAEWRIFKSGHADKTDLRTNREAQQELFG
jgi:DNA modification methylase